MFARITRVASSPDAIDERVALFEREVLPRIEALSGFLGAAALGNRDSGQSASVTYWADAAAMGASEDVATSTRDRAVQAGSSILDIQRYEMVIVERVAPSAAHLFVHRPVVASSPPSGTPPRISTPARPPSAINDEKPRESPAPPIHASSVSK